MSTYVDIEFYPQIEMNDDGTPRPTREFKSRDGRAFASVQQQLPSHWIWADSYENLPREAPPDYPEVLPSRGPEFDWVDQVDLFVQTIRPPISDNSLVGLARRRIPRSFTWLENTLLTKLETRFFSICSRESIKIAKGVAVPPAHQNRSFLQNGVAGSWYAHMKPRRTSGYVAFLPKQADFPAVLNLFGMGGNDTLRLAHLLQTRAHEVIGALLTSTQPTLLVFEMAPPAEFDDAAPLEPGLLGTRYRDWSFELVVDTRVATPGHREVVR